MYIEPFNIIMGLINSLFAFAPPPLRVPFAMVSVGTVFYLIGGEVSDEEKDVLAQVSKGGEVSYSTVKNASIFVAKLSIKLLLRIIRGLAKSIVSAGEKLNMKLKQAIEVEDSLIKIDSLIVIRGFEITIRRLVVLIALVFLGGGTATILDTIPFL